jgi:FAD/FMN-containing dehydrogenase
VAKERARKIPSTPLNTLPTMLEKRDFVDRELDVNSLELMRSIKRQFDPNGILNPDKMFPLS